jgi:urease accessory protein
VSLPVDRLQLQKRRWRAAAADGTEFGFDLEQPLTHGAIIHQTTSHFYEIEQQPEPVLDIELPDDPTKAARIGWMIGNLHFAIEIRPGCLRVADDQALRRLLALTHVHYLESVAIFQPLTGGAHVHHH